LKVGDTAGWKTCATTERYAAEKFAQKNNIFTDSNSARQSRNPTDATANERE
jgi:hypothetical protein